MKWHVTPGSYHESIVALSPGLAVIIVVCLEFTSPRDAWDGKTSGEDRTIAGLKLCWCPPGRFTMGSPPSEPELPDPAKLRSR